jgi:hypothetical protein
VVVEDGVIDSISIHRGRWGAQLIAGCACKHVVVRGRIQGALRLIPSNEWLLAWPKPPAESDALVGANRDYYKSVDWALDISGAEFTDVELEESGIPAHLVRRDPETQVVVTRKSVEATNWRRACGESALWVGIERFLATGFSDTVLVAAKRGRRFAADVAALRNLRAIGAALPD